MQEELHDDHYALLGIYTLFAIAVICWMLFGCTSVKYVPVETVRTEYKTKTDTFIQKDSVHVKDSVSTSAKGDTLLIEKWHTKYVDRWRDRIVTDSFVKVDSIQVPYPVERKLSRWEQFCLDYGKVMLGTTLALVTLLFFLLARWLAGHRRKNM